MPRRFNGVRIVAVVHPQHQRANEGRASQNPERTEKETGSDEGADERGCDQSSDQYRRGSRGQHRGNDWIAVFAHASIIRRRAIRETFPVRRKKTGRTYCQEIAGMRS